jgi:hypothetical protein
MAKKRKARPVKAVNQLPKSVVQEIRMPRSEPEPEPVVSLRLPRQQRAVPLGSLTTDFSSATFATVPSLAAVKSSPTQSLIGAKTGVQTGPGSRVLGPGSRVALRVLRF